MGALGDAPPFCGLVDEEFEDAEGVDDAEDEAFAGRVVVVVVFVGGCFCGFSSLADGV